MRPGLDLSPDLMPLVGRALRKIRVVAAGFRDLTVTYLPGAYGQELREQHWRRRLRHLGRNVRIDVGVIFVNPEYVTIGDNCWIDRYVLMMAGPPTEGRRKVGRHPNSAFRFREGELVVGENCHIASHVVINGHGGVAIGKDSTVAAGAKIVSLTHSPRNPTDSSDTFLYKFGSCVPEEHQALVASPVVLGKNSGLATNAVMLPGTSIGADSWVGAGSVVTKDIPPGWLAWGAPARPMVERSSRAAGA